MLKKFFHVNYDPETEGAGAGSGGAPAPAPVTPAPAPAPAATPPSVGTGGSVTPDALDKVLDSAWDRGMRRHNAAKGLPDPEAAQKPGEGAPAAPGAPAKAPGVVKDPVTGKYMSANNPAAKAILDAQKTAPAPAAPAQAQAPAQAPAAPREPIVPMPEDFPAEALPHFASASPELQTFIAAREAEYTSAFQQIEPVVQFGVAMNNVVSEYADYFTERPNLTPDAVFGNYLAFDSLVASNPAAAIVQLAAQTGVDLVAMIEAIAEGRFSPREAILEHNANQANRRTKYERTARDRADQMAAQAEQEEAERRSSIHQNATTGHFRTVIDRVASSLPDWGTLEADIAAILPTVIASNPRMKAEDQIKEAHSRARRANPTTFAKMQSEAQAKAQAGVQKAQEKAESARLASSINVGGATLPAHQKDLRSVQDAAWARGMERNTQRKNGSAF